MSVPSLKSASEEKSLIALYASGDSKIKDTLYLTQGSMHGGGYHYYSDDYFVGYTGKLDKQISKIVSNNVFMASVANGEPSGYAGINEIPEHIVCKDSTGKINLDFTLMKTYPENIELGSKKSYIKE